MRGSCRRSSEVFIFLATVHDHFVQFNLLTKTHLQKKLADAINEALKGLITPVNSWRQAFLASIALPGAQEWFNCLLCLNFVFEGVFILPPYCVGTLFSV